MPAINLTPDEARSYGKNCVSAYNEFLKDVRKEITKQAKPQGADNANRIFADYFPHWHGYFVRGVLASDAVYGVLND